MPAPATPPFSSTDQVVGRYALTLSSGTACDSFPEIVRSRIYTADIVPTGDTTYPYMVKLYDASFPRGCQDPRFPRQDDPRCNQFVAWRSDDSIVFDFLAQTDDAQNWEWNKIVEDLIDGTWIELSGKATGQMNGKHYGRGAPLSQPLVRASRSLRLIPLLLRMPLE